MATKKKRKGSLLNPSGYTPSQVRLLHRQGFNVRGYIPGAPDAIQPRLNSYLKKQAVSTVRAAYSPAQQELSAREASVKAIMDKRSRDHQAFQQWLLTQQASLRSEQASRDAQLQATVAQHQQDTKNAMLEVQQHAATNLAAQKVAGDVNGPTGVVTGAQQAAIESGAAKATALTERQSTGAGLLAANQANAMAFMKAQEAKDFARGLQELADVADARTKLKLQQGADVAKEIAHLLDQEIGKAQQNQQLQLAGQKLGVQLKGIQQRDLANKRTTGTAKRGQDLQYDLGIKKITQSNDKLAETQRHNRQQEKNARDKLKKTDPSAASKQERAQRTGAIRSVNRMRNYMIDKLGRRDHLKTRNPDDFNTVVQTLREQYPNDADLILVAYDLWRFGHLRGGSRNRWKNEYGYALPKGW